MAMRKGSVIVGLARYEMCGSLLSWLQEYVSYMQFTTARALMFVPPSC